jgi:hypothetical protein
MFIYSSSVTKEMTMTRFKLSWFLLIVLTLAANFGGPARAESLQQYAAKCDAATGVSVPEFKCSDGTEVLVSNLNPANAIYPGGWCDRPARLTGACDPGSRFQVLVRTSFAYVVAHCRKKGNPVGKWGDIAVIQHNTVNGATCFYQEGPRPNLSNDVKAPSAPGPNEWQQPAQANYCVGCHDNGPLIRSPYITQHMGSNTIPGAGDRGFNSADEPYFFVGRDFAHLKAFRVELPGNKCLDCHRLGTNNHGQIGTARNYATLSTQEVPEQGKNPHSAASPLWMPWPSQSAYVDANHKAAEAIRDCALGVNRPTGCRLVEYATTYTGPSFAPREEWVPLIAPGLQLRDVEVARNADGRLEAFALAADNTVHHTCQKPGIGWQEPWEPLFKSSERFREIRAGINADGRLKLFALAHDNSIWHTWQTPPNGWLGHWALLHGSADRMRSIEVAANADGRLEVIGIAPDDTVWHTWQLGAGGWNNWTLMHSRQDRLRVVRAARDKDGRLVAIGVAPDDSVWSTAQLSPNGGWEKGWTQLGTTARVWTVEIGRNRDGRLEAFGLARGDSVWHTWQDAAGTWRNSWQPLHSTNDRYREIRVDTNKDGRLEVVGIAPDNSVWHTWQELQGGWHTSWVRLHNPPDMAQRLEVGQNSDGRLEVFGVRPDAQIWHTWQVNSGGWNREP